MCIFLHLSNSEELCEKIDIDEVIKSIYYFVNSLIPSSMSIKTGNTPLVGLDYIYFFPTRTEKEHFNVATRQDKNNINWKTISLEIPSRIYFQENKDRKEMENLVDLMYKTFTLDFYTKSKYSEIIPSEIIDSYWSFN